jgi:hypothetical protein
MTSDDGRDWAMLALGLPFGLPGAKFWNPYLHDSLNPWPAHWALQDWWHAT